MNDMGYGSYDSPTFLGRQDKLMMGLSLMQMLMVMGTFAGWFVISLMFVNFSMLQRFMVILPCEIITVVFLMLKPFGLPIPVYVFLMARGLVVRPMFESDGRMLVRGSNVVAADGSAEAVEAAAVAAMEPELDEVVQTGWRGKAARVLSFGRAGAKKGAVAAGKDSSVRNEVAADVERAASESARNFKQSVESALKMLTK